MSLKNYFPLQVFAAKKILLFLLVFSYTFFISCKKQDFRPPESENDIALQQVRNGKDSQSLATLLNIPELDKHLKSSILTANYHYFTNNDNSQLWIASLAPGTYGLATSKIAVSLKQGRFSMIITSYDYDKSVYKEGDFSTYTGTISVYNQHLQKVLQNSFRKGLLQPKKGNNDSTSTASFYIVITEPEPIDPNYWCIIFPPLCDYNNGGGENNSGDPTQIMASPDGAGGSGGSNNEGTDPNGYLYSRITELKQILQNFPEVLEPCDSLNIMPMETYGPMWKNVAQFTPSPYVKNRIDSIRNVLPGWIVDDYNIQSLSDAFGAIVNCDYFPVRITQMPPGMTPEYLLEYFRTHINSFIDPDLGVSFGPYYQGTIFDDSPKYYAPYEASVGSLWHLVLGGIPTTDGSVVGSGYTRINQSGYQSHYFTISTLETITDFEHPLAGNRRWGFRF